MSATRSHANDTSSVDFSHCSSNPCQNGGSCQSLIQGFICRCVPGFIGINCEIDVDECESHMCQNGATCTDGVNSFSCTCSEGYTGKSIWNDVCFKQLLHIKFVNITY